MKINQRLTLSFLGMLLFANTTYANWQGNWLVGVSSGYAERRGDLSIGLAYNLPNIFFPRMINDFEFSDKGLIWGGLVGYQAFCGAWLLGTELHVDWDNFDKRRDFVFPDLAGVLSWDVRGRYEREPLIALSARVGYEMAPYFLAYMRLGVETSKDKLDVRVAADTSMFPFGVIEMHDSRWLYRYLVGVGAETPVFCTPLSLRLEYNYHSKSDALESAGAISFPFFNPVLSSYMHPKENSIKVSVVWNFVA
ncbi:MAG: hypothetical protein BGO43_02700 [Gammaproteobacteria bacterium 39-13]|nr:outer membrane beta-barrel protein [Gammaproteobacteria bacterium]OJV85615.1 MAG: hypothetical protein BGO43_02700 [Gammaproteobacteria bacterium 39-13]